MIRIGPSTPVNLASEDQIPHDVAVLLGELEQGCCLPVGDSSVAVTLDRDESMVRRFQTKSTSPCPFSGRSRRHGNEVEKDEVLRSPAVLRKRKRDRVSKTGVKQ